MTDLANRYGAPRGFRLSATSVIAPLSALAFVVTALATGGSAQLSWAGISGLPLALFGASGYGRLIGRLAGPFLLVQAAAPLMMAFVVDRATDPAALALAAGFAAAALICFILIRRPK